MNSIDQTFSKQDDIEITAEQHADAKTTLAGDWDADGTTSLYLPLENAERLATRLGIVWNNDRECYEMNGQTYWQLDDALQTALTALGA